MSVSTGPSMPPPIPPDRVAAQRAKLWAAGFRPVPIYNAGTGRPSAGKAPKGRAWQERARDNPPACAGEPADHDALNTGILCDGLRAIDIDVDDPEIASKIKLAVLDRFHEAPVRFRANSSRCLLLYRAAEGEPGKRVVVGQKGKVEVLGRGQQFVAFGLHDSGAYLQWVGDTPGDISADELPTLTEDDVGKILAYAGSLLGAAPEKTQNGVGAVSVHGLAAADALQINVALSAIGNSGAPDWEFFNKIGMAIWAATSGSMAGMAAFHAWAQGNDCYDPAETQARWDHYRTSPPTRIGAGTLFHMAKSARQQQPDDDLGEPLPHTDDPTEASTEQPGSSDEPLIAPLPVTYWGDIKANLDANDFIEGLLIRESMSVCYGQSNSGKTFFISDLALHLAAGKEWNGRQIDHAGVLWLAMEGAYGISNRVAGWRIYHDIHTPVHFAYVPVALNLLDAEADVEPLVQTIRAVAQKMTVPILLTVVDTLSRAMAGGNENSPDDMGALVNNGARIQQATKSHVLWIHHSGKDEAKGARGHSLLRAATDTEIEIVAEGAQRTARVTKQREMECSGTFDFTLEVVELGKNRRGKAVTTCAVVHPETPSPDRPRTPTVKATGNTRRALDVLTDLIATSGATGFPGTPTGMLSVPDKWWRERFYERAMPDQDQGAKQKAFKRASTDLLNQHVVGFEKGRVWLIRSERVHPNHVETGPDEC